MKRNAAECCVQDEKLKKILEFQAVTLADGFCLHLHGIEVSCGHDWFIYINSYLIVNYGFVITIDGKQYVIYKDWGYTTRAYLAVPFCRIHLNAAQISYNHAENAV